MHVFFLKFWLFVKKYWFVLLLILGTVVGILLKKSLSVSTIVDGLREINKIHDEELKKIEQARHQERKLKEKATKKLKDTLVEVEKQYQEKSVELDAKKKREVEKLVKVHGNNPQKLAEELQKVTNFKIILPEE